MSERGQGNARKRPKRQVALPQEYRCERYTGIRKASYRSKAKARKAARLHTKRDGNRIYTYCCPRCGFWHLTHEPPRV